MEEVAAAFMAGVEEASTAAVACALAGEAGSVAAARPAGGRIPRLQLE